MWLQNLKAENESQNMWLQARARRERCFRDSGNSVKKVHFIVRCFCLPTEAILKLTKEMTEVVCPPPLANHSIKALLQVCTALRFYVTGSFLHCLLLLSLLVLILFMVTLFVYYCLLLNSSRRSYKPVDSLCQSQTQINGRVKTGVKSNMSIHPQGWPAGK